LQQASYISRHTYLLWGSNLQEKKENTPIKRMADLLIQGATLTDLSCPVCASPLFRLKDSTLWCANDEKKVVIVKEGKEPTKQSTSTSYDKLEATLLTKIQGLEDKIEKTDDAEELQKLSCSLSQLLSSLEKIQKMKKA
jgi:UPF0148 protein